MSDAVSAVERFRKAVVEGDDASLMQSLAEDVYWSVGGQSPIAGDYHGREAVLGMFANLRALTAATFRPFNQNSYDVLESEYHCALLDRWLADRADKSLDSHQAWIIHLSDGLVADGFHYFADQRAFDDFLA